MEKKNTGLIVLIVVLSIAVLGLGGFIIYDKVLNNDSKNNSNEINKEDNENKNENNKDITFNHTTFSVDYSCNFESENLTKTINYSRI